jgi:hypothetical protein
MAADHVRVVETAHGQARLAFAARYLAETPNQREVGRAQKQNGGPAFAGAAIRKKTSQIDAN